MRSSLLAAQIYQAGYCRPPTSIRLACSMNAGGSVPSARELSTTAPPDRFQSIVLTWLRYHLGLARCLRCFSLSNVNRLWRISSCRILYQLMTFCERTSPNCYALIELASMTLLLVFSLLMAASLVTFSAMAHWSRSLVAR